MNKSVLFLSFGLLLFSCSKTDDVIPEKHEDVHWDYEHTDWQNIGFVECEGVIQSPINIETASTIKTDLPNLSFVYSSFPMKIIDNGHTLQVNNNGTNSVMHNGTTYNFLQFHFHYHSEHKLDGEATEMEMHLVHQDPESKALLVVGLFVKSGGENTLFKDVLVNWPTEKEHEVITTTAIDLSTILPTDRKYYTYVGSLTTPPCSQGVSFYLFKEKIEFSKSQIDQFKAIYDHNARPIQPLNARLVFEDIN
jgi:carbonic anhydrase